VTYTTLNGEVRVTVSARFAGADLDRLDALVDKLSTEWGRQATRSDALRAGVAAAATQTAVRTPA
jgi:hypothetical protein